MLNGKILINTNLSCFLLIFVSIYLAYCNSFSCAWQFDDKPNIVNNSKMQMTSLSLTEVNDVIHANPSYDSRYSGNKKSALYRPVACLSLGLNWYLGQDNVFGYHVVNLLIHFTTAWFLFLTIQLLLNTPRLQGQYERSSVVIISLLACLFWALNPMQTQAVTYIVQRMSSLAAMFSVLSFFCYLKARMNHVKGQTNLYFSLSAIAYLMALLSKENAVVIVFIYPVIEFIFFCKCSLSKINHKFFVYSLGGLVLFLFATFALHPGILNSILHGYDARPFTLLQRILTEQRILIHYLAQLFVPLPSQLSITHDIVISTSIISPITTILAILGNLLIVSFALSVAKRYPLLSFSILFFYITHLVESSILPLELIYEHRNYLPSLFLFSPLAVLIHHVFFKLPRIKMVRVIFVMSIVALLLFEMGSTYTRNKIWLTEETLWLDAQKKAPNSSRPLSVLAVLLAFGDDNSPERLQKAKSLMQLSLTKTFDRQEYYYYQLGNLASIYSKLGDYENAILTYNKTLDIMPHAHNTRFNLSKVYLNSGRLESAKKEINVILATGVNHPDFYYTLGHINLWLNQIDDSYRAFHLAYELSPTNNHIRYGLAKTSLLLGKEVEAEDLVAKISASGNVDPFLSLGVIEVLLRLGENGLAKENFQKAVNKFSLERLLAPLDQNSNKRYRRLPLSRDVLIPFIRAELNSVSESLLQ